MSRIYAQLGADKICIGVSQLTGSVESQFMIEIDSLDLSLIGKKYNNGMWEEVPIEPTPEPPLSPWEQVQLDTALNVEYLICLEELKA